MSRLDDPIAMPVNDRFNRKQRGQIAARKAEKPKGYRLHADGAGYDVYHPTKGWRRYSAARVRAEGMALAKRVGQLPWWAGVKPLERIAANG